MKNLTGWQRTWKKSGVTGNQILTFTMTWHNALSIKLMKPNGEQAIVSSSFSRDINIDCKKKINIMIMCNPCVIIGVPTKIPNRATLM